MRRLLILATISTAVLLVVAFSAGLLTKETCLTDECPICRAMRIHGAQYGISYERISENDLTRWYRANIDSNHGSDASHPHLWRANATNAATTPILLLRPEIELEALQQLSTRQDRIALISSLNTPDNIVNEHRMRILIRYHFLEKPNTPWDRWWLQHHGDFGM